MRLPSSDHLLLPPPLDFIKRKHIRIVVHALQQIQRIPNTSADVVTRPDDEPRPIRLIRLQLRRLHNRPNLSCGDDLRIASQG